MLIAVEIAGGGAVLLACALLHIYLLLRVAVAYRDSVRQGARHLLRHNFRSVVGLFSLVALSHVAQVGVWAVALIAVGALPDTEEAVYFALVTYTTVGYGDVVLTPEFRVFGAMASMSGILCFGLSTALLVGYFTRLVAAD